MRPDAPGHAAAVTTGETPTDPWWVERAEVLARVERDQTALRSAAERLRDALLAQVHLGHHLARRPAAWLVGGLALGFTVGLMTRRRSR